MPIEQIIRPEDVKTISGAPLVDYILDRAPWTRYRWDGTKLVAVLTQDAPALAVLAGYTVPLLIAQVADVSGSRTVTATTDETSVFSTTIPGGALGPLGSLRISGAYSRPNNNNPVTVRIKFGNVVLSASQTAVSSVSFINMIRNKGAETVQTAYPSVASSVGATTTAMILGTVDTREDQLLEITVKLNYATDSCTLEGVTVELLRP